MLLKLDTHNKQVNDTVNTLKVYYNDVYANIMHNDHILCYLVFPYSWPNIYNTLSSTILTQLHVVPALSFNVAGTSSVETVLQ